MLVLDEATSFADPQTEQAVRRALAMLGGDRTIIVIAHRLETVADADTVVVLEDGAIVERGRPADLLTRGGRVLRTEPLREPREPIQPAHHGLELDAVAFRHGALTVFDEVSLTVPEGQRLSVVGPSGAGKSTLLQLLARIAIVFQDVYLFDGTIEEDVRLGRPGAGVGRGAGGGDRGAVGQSDRPTARRMGCGGRRGRRTAVRW
jgi:ATP-binding cassette subfamily B protein